MSNFVQAQTFILHSNASISDTTVTVKDFVGLDGSNLTLADFGTKGFATLNPGVANAEEAISFTGVTQNGDGTATLTGVSTQLTESPYTETSGLAKSHISGATFVLSNTAGFYDHNFVNKNEDQTISGVYTFADSNTPQVATAATEPTLDAELVHKKFVDDNFLNIDGSTSMTGNLVMDGNDINMATGGRVLNLTDAVDPQEPATLAQLTGSIAGAPPNASETVKGVVEEATQAEVGAGTDTGSTGAKLFVPPSKLQTYVSTSIDENQRVLSQVLFSDGLFTEWVSGSSSYEFIAEYFATTQSHLKLFDQTNRILIVLFPYKSGVNNGVTVKTFKFNEYFQLVHSNTQHLSDVVIDDSDPLSAVIDGSNLYIATVDGFSDHSISKYSIDSTTGELTFVLKTEWSNAFLDERILFVTDSYLYVCEIDNATTFPYSRIDKTTLTRVDGGTGNALDSDGSTPINMYDIVNTSGMSKLGDYYYAMAKPPSGATTYRGDGWEFSDASGVKLTRKVSTNLVPWGTAIGGSGDCLEIIAGSNRRIFFEHGDVKASHAGGVFGSMVMNVDNVGTVVVTTL